MSTGKRARKVTLQLCSWVILNLVIKTSVAQGVTSVPVSSSKEESGGIILMRHAEGEQNVEQLINTRPEHSNYTVKHLTARGRNQASAAAEKLQALGISGKNLCKVLVSPLPRAQETADIVMDQMQISGSRKKTVDALIESGAGDREGHRYDEFIEDDAWFPKDPRSFGGETRNDITLRTRQVLEDTLKDAGCNLQNEYVLLISHGSPIYVMLDLLTGRPEKITPASFRVIHNPGLVTSVSLD